MHCNGIANAPHTIRKLIGARYRVRREGVQHFGKPERPLFPNSPLVMLHAALHPVVIPYNLDVK
jgi:hypothetical protein